MTDRYQGFVQSPIGKLLVKNLGLPAPVPLKRYTEGDPLVTGTVLTGGPAGRPGRLAESLPGLLDVLGVTHAQVAGDQPDDQPDDRSPPATAAWSSTPPASPTPRSSARSATSSGR